MSLAGKCSHSFDLRTRSKGQAYYSSGMVRDLAISDRSISATVRGSQADDYSVELDITDPAASSIVGRCSCPHYQEGHLCKHIWAVLLANDNNAEGVTCPRPKIEVVHRWQDEPLDRSVLDLVRFPPDGSQRGASVRDVIDGIPRSGGSVAAGSRSAGRGGWRQQFAALAESLASPPRETGRSRAPNRRREIWYLLNLKASQSRKKLLAIDFYQREQRKTGQWGTLKRFQARADSLHEWCNAEDQRLIELLIGNEPDEHADSAYANTYGGYFHSYRGFNRSWVRPGMYEWLLPMLATSGRFIWSSDDTPAGQMQPVVWDEGPQWETRLRLETVPEDNCWRLVGDFIRGEEQRVLESALMVLTTGLILFPDRLCRVDLGGDANWVTTIRKNGPIKIPFKDRAPLLRAVCKLPHSIAVDCPPDLCEREVGTPQPRLELISPKHYMLDRTGELWAKLTFQYGDKAFAYDESRSAAFDEQRECLIARNVELERKLVERLPQVGFRPPATYYARQEADFVLNERQLIEVVQTLTAEGWVLETQGTRVRKPGDFHLQVRTTVDWFELHGTIDFDGVTASLPDLLKALRENASFVKLEDGSQGLLPEEWLKKYGQLAELAEFAGEKLKFSTAQGLLLDALLMEQENVQLDQGFVQYREKLQSFSGIEAAAPVASFRGELRQYQREGLGWLHFLREFRFGGCLADDMGLGKTVQVLALLEARRTRRLNRNEERRPSIVVVPKSLVFNWIQEAARFTPELRVLNFTGVERGNSHANPRDYDVLITTYGTLRRDVIKLKDFRFDYAVLDEAQAIKNSTSQAAKACRLIRADHRLAMSGTPIENHLGELWSLFDFLNPGMLGRSTAFATLSRNAGDQDRASLEVLSRAVRPFLLRRTKEQVLSELPEKLEQTVICEMSADERQAYEELRDYYRVQLTKTVKEKGIARSKIHVLEALLRLRQAACHPGLLDKQKIDEGSAKLEVLLEHLQDVVNDGHKALVFSQFTSLLAIVRRHLDQDSVRYEYLDGQTRNRGEHVRRFQEDPDCRLFLISLKAGGHGLNLTAADYVFILDPWWNPAVEAQAVDRAHRIGQTRRVFAYRLIARDTVEDKILELQQSKKDLADAIVSANNSLIRSLTSSDLELLLS